MRYTKAVIAGVAAMLLGAAPSLAQNPISPMGPGMMPQHGPSGGPSSRNGHYMGRRPPGGWHPGQRLQGRIRPMANYAQHHLPMPPPGQGWVWSGPQYLLVSLTTGIITAVVPRHDAR